MEASFATNLLGRCKLTSIILLNNAAYLRDLKPPFDSSRGSAVNGLIPLLTSYKRKEHSIHVQQNLLGILQNTMRTSSSSVVVSNLLACIARAKIVHTASVLDTAGMQRCNLRVVQGTVVHVDVSHLALEAEQRCVSTTAHM